MKKNKLKEHPCKRICVFTDQWKSLNSNKNEDLTTTDKFKSLLNQLGEYPSIKLIEDVLDHYKEKKQKIQKDDIPDLMMELGLNKITLDDGTSVRLQDQVNVTQLDKESLFDWLEDNGYGDFIKKNLDFNKGEVDEKLHEFLNKKGYSFKEKTGIHYQSLNKIIRDRIDGGEDLPNENIVKVSAFTMAVIKQNME